MDTMRRLSSTVLKTTSRQPQDRLDRTSKDAAVSLPISFDLPPIFGFVISLHLRHEEVRRPAFHGPSFV